MKKEFKVEGVDKNNPNGLGGMCSRAIPIDRESIDFERGIDTVATTDAAVLVMDWERWEPVREILPMRYAELPETDKVPLLDTHSRGSIEKIKGSARNWTAEGGKLSCKCFVSASEEEVRQKIKEGHLDSVSIGYLTDKNYTVEVPRGANVVIDGTQYKNEFNDNYPMVVRTWWKTIELSLVPIGADDAAKFKSLPEDQHKLVEKVAELSAQIEELKKPKEPEKEKRGLTYHEAQVRLLKYL